MGRRCRTVFSVLLIISPFVLRGQGTPPPLESLSVRRQAEPSKCGARAPLRDPLAVGAAAQKKLLRYSVQPVYPRDSEGAGKILLDVVINEEGAVYSIRFLRCPLSLRASVEAAVCQWRYKPNCLDMCDAVPIRTIVELSYNFSHYRL